MAWPSGTKAGTTNVDAGSDRPALARADIKQNIDNVNAIIDEFDIASPSNGDILTYNSTSGAWEPGAAGAGANAIAVFQVASGEENVSGSIYRNELTEIYDPNGIFTLSGSYQFTLTAGSYWIEMQTLLENLNEANFILYNETDSTTEATFTGVQIATVAAKIYQGNVTISPGSTKNYSIRQDEVTTVNRNAQPVFKIFA